MSRQKSKEKKAVEEEVAAATEEGEEASGPIPITKLEVLLPPLSKLFLIPIIELRY